MVFGVVFYGYIIANVAASIAAADAQRARFQGRLDGIKRFLTVSQSSFTGRVFVLPLSEQADFTNLMESLVISAIFGWDLTQINK